jgi:fatty acid desaturase
MTEEVMMADNFTPSTDQRNGGGRTEPDERARVRKQLEARRELASHVFVFVVVNTAVVVIWAITGSGYFWPAWLIGLWGVGLVMHTWDVFIRRQVTDEDVDEAMRRRQSREH